MLVGCSSLPDIKPLQNWNVSIGKDFRCMFIVCSSLSDYRIGWFQIEIYFGYMLSGCSSLSDVRLLHYRNVSNGNNFRYMLYECSSLSDIKPLQNWSVSNDNNFGGMFLRCSSLSDIKPLQNWKISKNLYKSMF